MSSLKTVRILAVVIAAAIAGSATTSAWAQAFAAPHGPSKTYMPGEGGCKDDSGQGWVTYGCGD